MSLVLDFNLALEEAARGLQEGADKYGRGNWKNGFPLEEILDSAMSHITKHMAGEMFDPDSKTGATHLGKFLCNALLAVQLHNPTDKRPKWENVPDLGLAVDRDGYDSNGFNAEGWHRTHDAKNDFCNCPSCR